MTEKTLQPSPAPALLNPPRRQRGRVLGFGAEYGRVFRDSYGRTYTRRSDGSVRRVVGIDGELFVRHGNSWRNKDRTIPAHRITKKMRVKFRQEEKLRQQELARLDEL